MSEETIWRRALNAIVHSRKPRTNHEFYWDFPMAGRWCSIAPRLGNANIQRMPRMRKMTFRLDAETLELVNGLAQRWKVSKSEAVRWALNQAPMTAEQAIATVDPGGMRSALRRSSSDVEIKTR